jgi:predicted MPP superfamily phosphohydrolase
MKVLGSVGVGALFGGFWIEFSNQFYGLKVHHVDVRLPDLPKELDGFTIGHLSDLHRGRFVTEKQILHAAETAMSLKPDMIVITGDFVTTYSGNASSCARALQGLKAPKGVYGVLGNHDYSEDVSEVIRAIKSVGVRLLINESVKLHTKGVDWYVCGVDDPWHGQPELESVVHKLPKNSFKVSLCHEPDYADQYAHLGISLQLSGHSHGGQVVLPFIGAPLLPEMARKYIYGLRQVDNSRMRIYTSSGVGGVLPIRLNCPPEVALLTLRHI